MKQERPSLMESAMYGAVVILSHLEELIHSKSSNSQVPGINIRLLSDPNKLAYFIPEAMTD